MPTIQQVGKPRVRLRALPAALPLNIELQATDEAIQWRYVGAADDSWLDLVLIDDIDVEVTIGSVTTLDPGEPASVSNSGTSRDVVLDFGIPAGFDGTLSSVVAGSGIDVDATDPGNPIVSVDAALADLASRFTPASSSGPSSLDLLEDADNGTSRVRLTAAASLTADRTVTFPDADIAISAFGASLADDADAAAARTTLGLAIGTDVQAYDDLLAALAGLTGAAGSFVRFTGASSAVMQAINGTVSQSSGVPTGALFERGSNSNGEFTRLADGTQFCWDESGTIASDTATGVVFNSAGQTWTYPATFSAKPVLTGGATRVSSGTGSPWFGAPTTTGGDGTFGSYKLFSGSSNVTGTARLSAVGRWF